MKRRFTILTAALALLAILAIPMGMWGQAPVGTTLWGETWTGGDADETPSAYGFEGTTVYGGATLTYAQSSTNTKLYKEALAGGESPELLLSKSNQTWTISNIPTGQATGMALTFKSNKTTFDVTSTTTGITISGSQKSWTIASTSSVTTFNLTIKNTGSSNARIDDIVLSVTTAGGDTPQPTTYTVTYDANGGSGTMTDSDSPYAAGATVTVLGNEFTRTDYEFDHWNTAADDSGTSYDEGDTFTINANTTLYAQWTENTTPSGETATLNIQAYAEANNWVNQTQYTTATVSPVTFTANGGGNTGKYYTNGQDWRFYQSESASITITIPDGYTLVSVKPTYTVSNGGVLKNGNTTVASGTTVNVSGTSATFTVGNSGSATNGQVKFTNIDVVYDSDGSTQTASDLTITNQSTDLTFDLYNNTTAQVISYTTSSTGAITITPAESDYFSYVHDATAKTITVTPTAVTPSAQTVTISQEADDDYYAGSASFTVSIANSDPNVPGTVNNPYTVAQAIANTPSSGNVYIQGIVSSFYNTSIVGDGSNYRYYISDDGGTSTQLLVYKGTGLNQVAFSNVNDLLVGDEVVICGSLITYNSAPEIASGNYLYSWNRPVAAVEAPTFSPVAGTFTTAQTVTLSCATTGATIYYTLDGTEPTDSSTEYTNAIAVSTTTTIKAIAYVGSEASTVATATYHINSQDNPYTVAQALAFNEYPANGIYVHGIVSTAPTSLSSGTLTYSISIDGEATNELKVYKGKDLNNEAFTAVDDIQVGDIVTIYGNVVIYNGTKEFASGNYLVSFERPAQQYTLTVTCSENVEIFTFIGTSTDPAVEGATTQQVTSGTEIGLSVSASEGYVLTLVVDGTDVTSLLDETGYYTFNMPAHAVTVSATASVAPVVTTNTYTLATSIESGKQYIIVGWADGTPFAMGYDKGNNRHAVEISVTGDDNETASATIANTETNPHEFTITSLATAGFYSIQDATASGYLYAAGSSKNYLKTETTLDENHNGDWEISIDSETGVASVIASNSNNRNVMQFNHGDNLFACYASASQHPVYLYVKDETPYTLTIEGYGDDSNEGGYYLIASPVTVDPSTVGMTTGDFDLYYFDQAQDKEWINYEGENGNFNLEPGKGYLYAHKDGGDFTLTGTAYDGDGKIELVYDDNAVDFKGWNLVGNPWGEKAYPNHAFYTMAEGGAGIDVTVNEAGTEVAPMTGIFVVADGENETVTFSKTATGKSANLALNITNSSKLVDRAIVRFGKGRQLPKFQLRDNSTKIYFEQSNKDYAIVNAEEIGEMPVSFKAENNGTYTFSVNTENVEMEYLHLIDNMTGADIDLIANPSYSFEAKVTDYASRFRLVFSANSSINEQNANNFAFFNGNDWTINNEGEATLQVVDMTGRVLSTETINGNATTKVNAATGVYMLRLINGNNIKTQKVVVK